MVQPNKDLSSAISILRYLGYGLLVFALLDVVVILYPPQFTNPDWELQVIGQIVERVPVPLIGLAFVFLGDTSQWKFPERLLLKALSFLSLAIAALFLFLVPLGIFDTMRILENNQEQISGETEQRVEQIEQIKNLVKDANPQQLSQIAQQLPNISQSIDADNPQQLREEILSRLEQQQTQIQEQATNTQSEGRSNLLQNAIKWITGAFLAAVLSAIIFIQTAWVRKLPLKKS